MALFLNPTEVVSIKPLTITFEFPTKNLDHSFHISFKTCFHVIAAHSAATFSTVSFATNFNSGLSQNLTTHLIDAFFTACNPTAHGIPTQLATRTIVNQSNTQLTTVPTQQAIASALSHF
jgi:hypothetical protein